MTNYNEAAKRDDKSRVPKFDPRQMDKWELLIRAYLKRDQAEYVLSEPKPTVDVDKQATLHGDAEEGDETKEERVYLKWVKQEEEKWDKKNGIAYSMLVESCEGHAGAMVIILGRRGNDNAKRKVDNSLDYVVLIGDNNRDWYSVSIKRNKGVLKAGVGEGVFFIYIKGMLTQS